MCKVLIKDVVRVIPVKRGEKNGKAWELHQFECLVDVDDSGKEAVRVVKTFEASMVPLIKAGAEIEAVRQGDLPPFQFLVQKPKREGGGGSMKDARSVAFEAASRLVSAGVQGGCYDTPKEAEDAVMAAAERFLAFLKGQS